MAKVLRYDAILEISFKSLTAHGTHPTIYEICCTDMLMLALMTIKECWVKYDDMWVPGSCEDLICGIKGTSERTCFCNLAKPPSVTSFPGSISEYDSLYTLIQRIHDECNLGCSSSIDPNWDLGQKDCEKGVEDAYNGLSVGARKTAKAYNCLLICKEFCIESGGSYNAGKFCFSMCYNYW